MAGGYTAGQSKTGQSMNVNSVVKKFVMAFTGLLLILFLVGHLAGNLTLFCGAEAFNGYAHKLESLGVFLYFVEAGLVLFFVLHIISGVSVWLKKKQARPEDYHVAGNAGGASRKTVASKTMIWTGIVLLVFTVVHLVTFKFGPGYCDDPAYMTEVHGEPARDLHKLVVERFNPEAFEQSVSKDSFTMGPMLYTAFYVICMGLLGFHLRHAFWSGFQSLGIGNPKLTPVLYTAGLVVALLLAVGFLVLPIYLYMTGGAS